MKDLDIITQGDGYAEDIGKDEVGSEESEKREEEGETGKKVDAEEGPEREEEGDSVEGLKKGTEEEELAI